MATVEMTKLTKGLESKSEKMRVLARAGYSRGDIARYLGTSYQFVRNVLVREEEKSAGQGGAAQHPVQITGAASTNRILIGPDGGVKLPIAVRDRLGLKVGDVLLVAVEADEIRLMTIPTAVRKARELVRQYVPEGVSLVDELLEDRRREAESERQ